MGKYIKLTPEQKEEVRRLTQLANRRIRQAKKVYEKQGLDVLPKEVVGDKLTIPEKWATDKNPISRSVKFESKKAFNQQMKFLRQFDPKLVQQPRPTMSEYAKIQQEKTMMSMETALGVDLPKNLTDEISKLNAGQLAKFWKGFEDKATKMTMKYSSGGAMNQAINEFFGEDIDGFMDNMTNRARKAG